MYLRDVCLTLTAFVAAAPAAAPTLLGGGGSMLTAVGPIFEDLLPALASAAERQQPPAAEMLRVLRHLRLAVVQLAVSLLQHACLEAPDPLPGAGSANAIERGELLLSCLISLGEHSNIILLPPPSPFCSSSLAKANQDLFPS